MNRHRVLTIARTELRQLRQSRDFWLPMGILAAVFFVVLPLLLLFLLENAQGAPLVRQIGSTLDVMPSHVKDTIRGATPLARSQYALTTYLFAPLALVVPLTISTAVAANTFVGEREKGTGEFLASTPAREDEIYVGKLIASIVPGYLATLVGFGIYAFIVNGAVGPSVGGWFFPTGEWWVLMFWIVPPFIGLALTLVLRISATVKSSTAAQQGSALVTMPLIVVAYGQASGSLLGAGEVGWLVGLVAWLAAALGLVRGVTAVTRERLLGVG